MTQALLFQMMVEAAKNCIDDEYGPRKAEYSRSLADPSGIVFTTRFSRDPSRSDNGGEYYEYRRFIPLGFGTRVEERSSYEGSSYEEIGFFSVILSTAGLCRMADLACLRATAAAMPPEIDIKKVRRRVEDALRKTATDEDVLAVAALLGVKSDTIFPGFSKK